MVMTETMEIDAYFERIGYEGSREPTTETLRQLHRAHMLTVPFENLDIPLGNPIVLSLPSFYDKVVGRRRGGFCYELNGLFAWLLEEIGFEVVMVSARVFDGAQPGPEFDHLVLLVEMEETLVADVGFGDSFLEPLRLDSGDEYVLHGSSFRLTGPESERVLQRRRESDWEPQFVFSPAPRRLAEFAAMCRYHQTSPESTFTRKTVCSLATPDGRSTLSASRLIIGTGGHREEREVSSQEEYRTLLKTHFGIDLDEDAPLDRLMDPRTTPTSKNPLKHLRASDIRGAAQMATQATAGVTRIAEGVHRSVWDTMGIPGGKESGLTRGITGLVYKSVHDGTLLLGKGVDMVLTKLQPFLESAEKAKPETLERERMLAALNGVIGDRLVADSSPFATPMTLRYRGQALNWQALPPMPHVTGKVLLLIHGLCMNDLQWRVQHEGRGFDHGENLESALGYTPVYLRYNSGLHTSQNGRELSAQLEQLITHWPIPIEDLTVVAHSMGGLVTRSAFHCAMQEALSWPDRLKHIVFLGTPHHGAPLERAGNWVDVILGSTPYSAPFAKLGQLRSPGITDLRYGHVVDEDWQGHPRFRRKPDSRQIVPLPEGVACFTVAATTAAKRSPVADRLIGDGLVPLNSALGSHKNPRRNLVFEDASQLIVYRTNHLELLSSPEVSRQVVEWLGKGNDEG
jgi:arylamine N-acetyltransferase/pimeloyl-ACP methyl ester carboxylesterase